MFGKTPEWRTKYFSPEDLVRLSIGIENIDDIIDDLDGFGNLFHVYQKIIRLIKYL